MGIPLRAGPRRSPNATTRQRPASSSSARRWRRSTGRARIAIGKRITISYNKTGPREIVGIVGDVKQRRPDRRAAPQMYTPFVQTPWPFMSAVVRTTAAPEAAAGVAARRCWPGSIRCRRPARCSTLDEYVARSVATPRFTALLVGSFAGARAAAGGLRPLRRHGVFGGAAGPRDRHPDGARRAGRAMSARWSSRRRCAWAPPGSRSGWSAPCS